MTSANQTLNSTISVSNHVTNDNTTRFNFTDSYMYHTSHTSEPDYSTYRLDQVESSNLDWYTDAAQTYVNNII